ncbi:MAG: serine hydrolase, partial [Anaerolinea sp.]|nr:serine hydrolase [Anaerolinea sp.]
MKRLLTVFVILMLASSAVPILADGDAPFPTKEWAVSTPEEQGVSSKELLALLTPFTQENFHFDSLVVVRNGYIIAEAYNAPYGPENTHQLASASKMVTAMAVGIALKEGLIKSLDETMISFFPDRQINNLDDRKKAITLRHMLTFSDGLECDDMFVPVMQQTIGKVMLSSDPIQATLDLPMAAEPGKTWHYCNGVTYLLSAIVGKVAGMSMLDYLDQKLFAPLGISKPTWHMSKGIQIGFSELFLNTRDMAKIGHLLMQKGKWDDL